MCYFYFRILSSMVLIVTLVGCETASPHFYKTTKLSTKAPTAITMDAKKRSVIAMPYRPGDKEWISIRFCAEPSPDVFSAIASSFGAAIEADVDAESKKIALGTSIAKTLQENAATIERTQTINILRESMYRTCERYLSGAVRWKELVVQAARDQRTMIAILAIEQLTGVAKAQSTALTTAIESSSTTGGNSLEILAKAKASNDLAKSNLDKSIANSLKVDPIDVSCSDFSAIEIPDTETDAQTIVRETKEVACKGVSDAQTASASAKEYYDAVLKMTNQQTVVNSASSGAIHTASMQMSAASEHIADTVLMIVKEANDFDEVLMTCVTAFREVHEYTNELKELASQTDAVVKAQVIEYTAKRIENESSLRENCMTLVTAMITNEISELKVKTK